MSGLTQTNATTPIADNQIQFNIMDPNNSNNTLVSFNWTKTGATRNSYLRNYNTTTHNWSLDSNDQASLQTAINNALSGYNSTHGTNYSYNISNLTQAQLNNLAVAQFGGSVKLYLNSNIADNALRVYFKTPNGTVLSNYYDWTKLGANRGNLVGYQNGSNWSFYGNDQSDIQGKLATALAGTGYGLNYNNNNTLNQDQINAIASGHYGSSVTISVVPVTNMQTTDIVPTTTIGNVNVRLARFSGADSNKGFDATKQTLTGKLPDNPNFTLSMSAFDISKLKGNDTAFKTFISTSYGNDQQSILPKLSDLNKSYADAALKQYIEGNNSDWTYGPSATGTTFTTQNIADQINETKNSDMQTMYSPAFPVFASDGSYTWEQFKFTDPAVTNSGTIGQDALVNYKADPVTSTLQP